MARKHGFFRPHMGRGFPQVASTTMREGGGFALASFMVSQVDGLFFDTTNTDRYFQENVGPTLADDVGEAMGLALDQRAWAGQTPSQVLSAQTELLIAGSWTMSVAGGTSTATESPAGTLNLTGDGTNQARGDQSFTTVVGRTYRIRVTATGGTVGCAVGTAQGGIQNANVNVLAGTTVDIYILATATTTWVRLSRTAAGLVTASGISGKWLPGNHGVQATGTLKPLRQSTGAKFDGSDDNWLTPYVPGVAANFAVALVSIPASAAASQLFFGSQDAVPSRCFLGINGTSGTARVGYGSTSALSGTTGLLGQEAVIGFSADGTTLRLFVNAAEEASTAQSGSSPAVACRVGAMNANGSASAYFAGAVKKLVAGQGAISFAKYLQIRNALLTG